MKYYISDLHLCCRGQVRGDGPNYDGRPYDSLEEMHRDMRERWNRKVTNGDMVYILGDIGMRGKNEELISQMACLKGRKVLVKGNHDDLSDYRLQQLFSEICDYKELHDTADKVPYKVILSHYPILMWNGQHRGSILLYGHTHNSLGDAFFQESVAAMNRNPAIRHEGEPMFRAINVGCMHSYMEYEPRSLEELLAAKGGSA